eukprot:gene15006-16555_t
MSDHVGDTAEHTKIDRRFEYQGFVPWCHAAKGESCVGGMSRDVVRLLKQCCGDDVIDAYLKAALDAEIGGI